MYPAIVLLLYGLRRGEACGLRWRDVDEQDDEIRIRQQLQRNKGQLRLHPVKTAAGRRDLPLLQQPADVLAIRRAAQATDRQEIGRAWQDTGLVFSTKTGRQLSLATWSVLPSHLR